ncbi:MAG: type IX secretion system sortase PorU [Cyclobacteriaceae bacterium]
MFLKIDTRAQSSVLENGDWHKIGITKSGIYSIDRSTLVSWGVPIENIDATTLKIYGNAVNGTLPQSSMVDRPKDLIENAILGKGTQDGIFNGEDKILFYGEGPNELDFSGDSLIYTPNIYSDTAYYFLTYGGEKGKRVENVASNSIAENITTTYWHPVIHEPELFNLLSSGRRWLGDKFSNSTSLNASFKHELSELSGKVKIWLGFAAETEGEASFDFSLNQQFQANLILNKNNTSTGGYVLGTDNFGFYETNITPTNELNIAVRFNRNATALTSIGYLDYYHIAAERKIALINNELIFWNHSNAKSTYQVPASATQCWDISEPTNPKRIEIINGMVTSSGHKLVLMDENASLGRPVHFGKVRNQNIQQFTNVDGFIITHPIFLDAANELASFHQSNDGFDIAVVTTRQIYNEFSSGMQDLTAIRDFLRYVYIEGGQKLKYALLYGDGSFDYKNRINNNTNYVPIYESRESLHGIYSYSSDDYVGFLEDDEGAWRESRSGDHTLEIGVGRLPVKSVEEARTVNEKISRYATSKRTFGDWRNKFIYIADDGDLGKHMSQGEQFNAIIAEANPEVNVRKLYLDAFDQNLADRERSPQMQQTLLEKIKEGALVIDYMGHGNEFGLMQEEVITPQFIRQLDNRHRLPLFVTATCDFGKYDNPRIVSGAEMLLLSKTGGAIGLLTTTRPVFASTNEPVNEAFHRSTYGYIDGLRPTLGDIIKQTKNESLQGPINRNFALLGDPFLTLNYADFDITFDALENNTDTLSALQEITLKGQVRSAGQTVETFNGIGTLTVWDIPQEKQTKGQQNPPFTYIEQTNALHRGEILVENGLFETTLIIPKNTSYKFKNGKINAYFLDEDKMEDASGGSNNVIMGGSSNNTREDAIPPNISLFVDESVYKAGMTINQNSLFIAKLSDESGINISQNGFNQDLSLTLNDTLKVVLNDYYKASIDTYQKGSIVYPMENLLPGSYQGELIVWDSYNNSSSIKVEFKVSDQPILNLTDISIFPNPVREMEEITIRFTHDREGDAMNVNIGVFDMMGNRIITENILYDDSPSTIENIYWQPSTSLPEGMYFLNVQLISNQDGATNNFVKRLIIIN